MATAAASTTTTVQEAETMADLLEQLDDIPPERVMLHPTPGTATEMDVLAALDAPRKRLCELIDGVLVEKAVGFTESFLGMIVGSLIVSHVEKHDLGIVAGSDGPVRLRIGRVRYPDISFVSWARLPGGKLPKERIPSLAPDLAVEILSKSNTKKEIQRKLNDLFEAGTRLAWVINPRTKTAEVYTTSSKPQRLGKDGVLDGGEVLPGFTLPLADLFARVKRRRD